mmetsp:Transcript_96/g.253  ORF Transcript_96/g.253 Transcript_96/m.253 type:complete len:212 (+) Transcript_96:247-882(+)
MSPQHALAACRPFIRSRQPELAPCPLEPPLSTHFPPPAQPRPASPSLLCAPHRASGHVSTIPSPAHKVRPPAAIASTAFFGEKPCGPELLPAHRRRLLPTAQLAPSESRSGSRLDFASQCSNMHSNRVVVHERAVRIELMVLNTSKHPLAITRMKLGHLCLVLLMTQPFSWRVAEMSWLIRRRITTDLIVSSGIPQLFEKSLLSEHRSLCL